MMSIKLLKIIYSIKTWMVIIKKYNRINLKIVKNNKLLN